METSSCEKVDAFSQPIRLDRSIHPMRIGIRNRLEKVRPNAFEAFNYVPAVFLF